MVKDFLKKNEGHPIEKLLPQVVGNMGLIFTNGDLPKLRDLVSSNKVPAPARIGALAPIDVFVEPGPTGCDPGQTAWFQALNIPTKINKGQIEMISRVHLIHSGNKVTDSQAALLQKLNIRPFSYGLVVTHVYDAGEVYEAAALDISETDIISKFMSGVSTFAAVALGLGLPNKATVVHSINNAYKALLSIGMGTDCESCSVVVLRLLLCCCCCCTSGVAAATLPAWLLLPLLLLLMLLLLPPIRHRLLIVCACRVLLLFAHHSCSHRRLLPQVDCVPCRDGERGQLGGSRPGSWRCRPRGGCGQGGGEEGGGGRGGGWRCWRPVRR